MSDVQLIHYSISPFLGPVRSVPLERQDGRHSAIGKPDGLWVSVEEEGGFGWKEWCEGEDWGLLGLRYRSEIVLAADANVLRLSSAHDIDEFSARFRGSSAETNYMRGIDWKLVADAYSGIIIAPYIWERRLHEGTSWYYGWDCASGCIWDAAAVAEIRRLEDGE